MKKALYLGAFVMLSLSINAKAVPGASRTETVYCPGNHGDYTVDYQVNGSLGPALDIQGCEVSSIDPSSGALVTNSLTLQPPQTAGSAIFADGYIEITIDKKHQPFAVSLKLTGGNSVPCTGQPIQ